MMWNYIVVIWLLCGVTAMFIAVNKNRNGFVWFLLGLFFAPFALIAIAAVPKEIESGTVPCPFCAEPIKAQAIKCRYCGSAIDSDQSKKVLIDSGAYSPLVYKAKSGRTKSFTNDDWSKLIVFLLMALTAIYLYIKSSGA